MDDLNQTKQEIILAIDGADDAVDTSEIREWIRLHRGEEMTSSNVRQQAKQLVDMGLVEVVGERDVGAPMKANIYGLTDRGATVAEEITPGEWQSVTVGASSEEVRELRQEVADLSTAVDALLLRMDAAEETIGDHEDRIENLRQRSEWLRGRVTEMPGVESE